MLKKLLSGPFLTLIVIYVSCTPSQNPAQGDSKRLTDNVDPQRSAQAMPSITPPPFSTNPAPIPSDSALPLLSSDPYPTHSPNNSSTFPQASAEATKNPLLDNIKSLVISMNSYYIPYSSNPLSLRVLLKDADQKSLFISQAPLEFSSSRPEDIRISSTGELQALKAFGFSEITVSLVGTSLQAKQLFNIGSGSQSSGGGGGGGGGSSITTNPPSPGPSSEPVENIQARVNFQF